MEPLTLCEFKTWATGVIIAQPSVMSARKVSTYSRFFYRATDNTALSEEALERDVVP